MTKKSLSKKEKGYEKAINKDSIRKSLNIIILTMLKHEQMSGFEIIKKINEKFGVLFGPSTVYPLLHSLEEHGLLTSSKTGKSIIYKIGNKQRVHKVLYHHFKLHMDLTRKIRKK